jgi:hypothetical protein
MKDLKLVVAVFGLIVLVFSCGLFSIMQAIGSGPNGHSADISFFWTGIGLIAFLVWFVPGFLVVAGAVLLVKWVFFD